MVLKKKTREDVRKKKYALWLKLWECLDKYNKVLVFTCTNIGAHIIHDIRQAIREYNAVIVMGKNTLIKKGIEVKMAPPKEGDADYETRSKTYKPMPQLKKILALCEGHMGLIFCNGNLSEIKKILNKYECRKGAKVGVRAPDDVILPAGPTGLDPKQTGFFQALNIQTKIVKTQIDIINPSKIINAGQKLNASECSLLDKLGIKPFVFRLDVQSVYDNGNIYSPKVLDITNTDIFNIMRKGANNLTAVSLQAGYPTELSVKQSLFRGFKYMIGIGLESKYEFKELKSWKEAASKPVAVQAAPTAAKVEIKKEEEKKEEEPAMQGLGDIFGGDG